MRRQYKTLLKRYHPDNIEGSTEATQAINIEYEQLFNKLKDRHDRKTTNSQKDSKSTYEDMKYNFEEDEKLREVLQSIISFVGINIEIIGCWIWIDGDTYPYKDSLKSLGFKWARSIQD